MFTNGVAIAFGNTEAADTSRFCKCHVYIFHACSHPADAFERGTSGDKGGIDSEFTSDDETTVMR